VSSGFETAGDTLAFETPETELVDDDQIQSAGSEPVIVSAENQTDPLPPAFDSSFQASIPVVVENPQADVPFFAEAPVVVDTTEPEQTSGSQAPIVVVQPSEPSVELPSEPIVVVQPSEPSVDLPSEPIVVLQPSEPSVDLPSEPIVVVQPSVPTDEQRSSDEPIVVVQPNEPTDEQPSDEPIVVVQPNEPADEQPSSDEPIVVVQPNEPTDEQPSGDPIVIAQPDEPADEQPIGEEPVVVVVDEEDNTPPAVETPDSSNSVALSYSISANTNQDEQIGRLIFENGENKYSTLVFFGQEGQQKPTAVSLEFDLTGETSTVKLQYIDAFAGNSDAGTGHTATNIAIKDFGLGIDGVQTVLAQENDGVNIGIGNKSLETEGYVSVNTATGQVGEWGFGENSEDSTVDIRDLLGTSLDVGDIPVGTEVVNLEGSAVQELTLNAADVLNVSDGANVLHIVGGKEDTLNVAGEGWTKVDGDLSVAGTQASHFGWVQVNHTSGATLLVDPDVNVHLMG
jgi:hypothetical protein